MSEKMNTLKDGEIRYDDIEKVVIISQKQSYKKPSPPKQSLVINPRASNPKMIPDGFLYVFKITFKDHSKMTAMAKTGTSRCDKLLDLVSSTRDVSSGFGFKDFLSKLGLNFESSTIASNNKSPNLDSNNTSLKFDLSNTSSMKGSYIPKLGTNELPQGVYIIGKDIPPGIYDFEHVWGGGDIMLYTAKEETFGNNKLFQYIGTKESYQMRACVHVKCEEGWYLHVNGNLIVRISKSQEPNIDL